jgi:hypothetical protein
LVEWTAASKESLVVVDEEDVLDNPYTCFLALFVEEVLILDLDMKPLVLEISGDN